MSPPPASAPKPPPRLSLTEWAALGLLAEAPRHGFALARELGRSGMIGQVWTVPRPVVYRALASLEATGLARRLGAEEGERGPQRTLYLATPAGEGAFRAWLEVPVDHLREVRSALMLKLAFLTRRGEDPAPLLTAQAEVLMPLVGSLKARARSAQGFERTLGLWRLESARSAVRFMKSLRRRPPAG